MNISVEQIQSNFLRKILGVPMCVPYAALCLECGQDLMVTKAWLRTFKYWLRLHFNSDPASYTHLLLSEYLSSNWLTCIEFKLGTLKLSLESLSLLSESEAFLKIKSSLLDSDLEKLYEATNKTCSPLNLGLLPRAEHMVPYLRQLHDPKLRRAFSLARFNILPSAILSGRYHGISYSDRLCPCTKTHIETVPHVLLHCPFYQMLRLKCFNPTFNPTFIHLTELSDHYKVLFLLDNSDPEIIEIVAKFLYDAIAIHSVYQF